MDCGICNAAIWIAARPFWFCGGPILQSCLNERGSPTYLGLSYLPVRSANTEFLQVFLVSEKCITLSPRLHIRCGVTRVPQLE